MQLAAGVGAANCADFAFNDAQESASAGGRCNLPPEGGKLHRLFHASVPDNRSAFEVQLGAGGRQVASIFTLICAQ